MARTIADGLNDRDYEAVPVSSGREALDRLAAERFDALVTDLRMPDVDGLEILAASRSLDPDRPVIVMTAFSAVDTAVESIRQGAYHYLTKPFKQDELAIFLGRALDEARLEQEASTLKTRAARRASRRRRCSGTARRCAPCANGSSASRTRRRPCSFWARPAPARAWWRGRSTRTASARDTRSCR